MNTDLLVAILASIAIVLLFASWANRTGGSVPRPPGALETGPAVTQACQHLWLIAAREETTGHPRVIYRCRDCGAVEVREVA